jgi:bifunctional UDP-N-acetylglucosamine pyrophosphorylase/glucosamine-1-phosphate N-acetyltransferase
MNIVILAAGQGKRMHSNLPKVLHPVAGKALAQHVIDTARSLNPEKLVVVFGHGGEVVRSTLDAPDLAWANTCALWRRAFDQSWNFETAAAGG